MVPVTVTVSVTAMDTYNASAGTAYGNMTFEYRLGSNASLDSNGTLDMDLPPLEMRLLDYFVVFFLAIFILCVMIGNVFVILAVLFFRDMRTQTNYLIISLASADLLLSVIVLPISLHFEVKHQIWTLGPYVCIFWTTSDVFCCTASILNIVVIAVDRYWLISKNVQYTHSHNKVFNRKRVCIVLTLGAWIISAVISAIPLIGWSSEMEDPTVCMISQQLAYTIISTFGAFWFPLGIILIVYARIFCIAAKRARTHSGKQQRTIHPRASSQRLTSIKVQDDDAEPSENHQLQPKEKEAEGEGEEVSQSQEVNGNGKAPPSTERPPRKGRSPGWVAARKGVAGMRAAGRMRKLAGSRDARERARKRTRNSARTLGFIIGAFIICWLPFFIFATVLPFCSTSACQNPPPWLFSVSLWLGYSNSLLNPAIYAIWDKNFRRSFKRLIKCDVKWTMVL